MTDVLSPYLSDQTQRHPSPVRRPAGELLSDHPDDTIPSLALAAWNQDALNAAFALGELKANWDNEGSPPPSPKIVDAACSFIMNVASRFGTVRPRVSPTRVGTVMLSWQKGDFDLELEFETPSIATFLLYDNRSGRSKQGILCDDDKPPSGDLQAFRTILRKHFTADE